VSGSQLSLEMKEEDVLKCLAAGNHLSGTNLDFRMEQYIYKRKSDGIYTLNLKRTRRRFSMNLRIVTIENPVTVSAISSRDAGQSSVLKFAAVSGATPFGHFISGTFCNH
uniref:Uncharacterized protein n=1 Tax=Loxodonta africana TaxID=9785 RepID=G3UAS4_LOXAF